jgi:hypothetical protein
MLGEGEPSFTPAVRFQGKSLQEFLASPAVMRLIESQLSLAWVVQNCSQLAIFL